MSPDLRQEVDEFVKFHKGSVIKYPVLHAKDIVELSCGQAGHKGVRNEWSVIKNRGSVCRTCSTIERIEHEYKTYNKKLKSYLNRFNHDLLSPYRGRQEKIKIRCPNGDISDIKLYLIQRWGDKGMCRICSNRLESFRVKTKG